MAEEDQTSKTEDPTDKKVRDARNRGNIASSEEIKHWAILLAGALALILLAPKIMNDVRQMGFGYFQNAGQIRLDGEMVRLLVFEAMKNIGIILAPLFILVSVAALASNLSQVGWTVSMEKLKLKWEAFSPKQGIKKIAGVKSLVQFIKGVAKIAIISAVGFGFVAPAMSDVTLLPQLEIMQILERMHIISIKLVIGTVSVMTVVAVFDLMYQRYDHKKKLMMTKTEVKDENKQSEGDPMIKARLAQLRLQKSQARMMTALKEADVVITNPTHYAVALKYDMETMPAPKLVAKGMDSLAMRMREVAEENDIPIIENPPLARAIFAAVEIDQDIPPEHYKAVAEVIGYVFRLKGKLPGSGQPQDQGVAPGPGGGGGAEAPAQGGL